MNFVYGLLKEDYVDNKSIRCAINLYKKIYKSIDLD